MRNKNRIFPLLLLFFCHSYSFSQSKSSYLLKVTITDSVRKYIEKELLAYCPGDYQMEMNVSTNDMDTAANKISGNKSFSLADVKKYRKHLCNCGKDANTYLEIGVIYEHLNMSDSMYTNLGRGLVWVNKEKIKHTDSLNLLETEALIYSHKKDYMTCIEKCEYILTKKTDDSIASIWLPLLYLGVGDIPQLLKYTNAQIRRNPDKNYLAVFFNVLAQGYLVINDPRMKDTINKPYLKLPADSFVDFSSVYYLEKKFPQYHYYQIMDNYMHLFVYYVLKLTTTSISNSTDPLALINSTDTSHCGHFLSYFTELEKNKWYTNKYSGYKAIALSHLLLHHVKEAGDNFQKAIDAFPKGTNTYQINPGGDYKDLAVCDIMLRDTSGAENIINRSIHDKPGVDPDPYLYLMMARSAMLKHRTDLFRSNCDALLKIDPNNEEAYKLMAIRSIYEKDYKTALLNCDKAYAINKNDPDVFVIGGVANMLSDSPTSGHTMLKTVQDYKPDDDFVNNLLANYFF